MRNLVVAAVLGATACGWGAPKCDDPTTVLAGEGDVALTCDDADHVAAYVEILGGRAVGDTDREQIVRGLKTLWDADPAATRTALDTVRENEVRLLGLSGLEAAEARSREVYRITSRQDFATSNWADLRSVFERVVSVWATHDGDQLALTEVDIEGWIYYASLCREAQGAGPLRLSVADRVVIYRDLVDRFERTDREGRVALTALGVFWPAVREKWTLSDWDVQHAWIGRAPLPPPMTATSKGYFSALIEGDVAAHARVLHETLGPFRLSVFP